MLCILSVFDHFSPWIRTVPGEKNTVFPRSNAAATTYFTMRFTVATIRGRPLIEGGVY